MKSQQTMHERISAFADGELDEAEVEWMLAMLQTPEGKAAWEDYHRIGDAVRSDDMAIDMSPGFSGRVMAALDAEPPIVAAPRRAPAAVPVADAQAMPVRRYIMPGLAGAMLAALTVIGVQQWIGRTAPAAIPDAASSTAAGAESHGAPMKASMPASAPAAAASSPSAQMLRDPHIDDYLMAHQRFSPALHSNTQFARTATFAVDSDK